LTRARPRDLTIYSLFEITPAEDQRGSGKDYGDINNSIQDCNCSMGSSRDLAVSCRCNEAKISKVGKNIIETTEKPARSVTSHRIRESLKVRAEVSNDEDEECQQRRQRRRGKTREEQCH